MSEIRYYRHGRFCVAGGVLPDALTAYQTYGDPKNPCIVFPTCYGGRLDNRGLLGQDYMIATENEYHCLDPRKYYIVTLALFSNGESSSPSNTAPPYNGPYFPAISYADNIRAQYAVLTKALGVQKVHCVIGFSMGGQQAYHWAAMYPEFIEKFVAICGSARTSPHNKCFLEGPKAALVASKDFDNGHYKARPDIGIRAFGRAYSAWAYGQTWFRQHGYLHDGKFASLDDFLRAEWEGGFLDWDANDLLTLLHTWQSGDITESVGAGADFADILASLKPKGLIMPCKTDLYFPPEDSEIEIALMKNGSKLVVIDSVWGHMVGGGADAENMKFIDEQVAAFLAEA